MAEEKKQNEDWDIPIQVVENINVSTESAQPTPTVKDDKEMPTITSLLNRKKFNTERQSMPIQSSVSEPTNSAVAIPTPNAPVVVVNTTPPSEIDGPSLVMNTSTSFAAIQEMTPEVVPVQSLEAETSSEPIITPAKRKLPSEVSEKPASDFSSFTSIERRDAPSAPIQQKGEPPVFNKTLVLEKLELKAFEKSLKKNKKSPQLKKLDCLGYFSKWFGEILYFNVHSQEKIQGMLGFGNPNLVTNARNQEFSAAHLPSIMDIIAQGEVFFGAIENLRAEDQKGLKALGFTLGVSIAVVPMVKKKTVIGIWICTSGQSVEVPPKEIKSIKKIFCDLEF